MIELSEKVRRTAKDFLISLLFDNIQVVSHLNGKLYL